MGAVHRPGEPISRGGGEQLVFLRVVEVRGIEPRLFFMEGGVGHAALPVGLEGPEVMLEAGDQGHVLQGRVRKSGQQVSDHSAVDRDVLLLGGLP